MESSNVPMKVSDVRETSLTQDWLLTLRYWLGNRWLLIAIAAAVIVAGATLSWGWLVAAGIAPLLFTALPCVAMCALGLCMNMGKKGGASCGTKPAGNEKVGRDALPTTTPGNRRVRAPE